MKLKQLIEELINQHPYKVAGNADSYSDYNQGWSDALGVLEGRLEEIQQPTAKVTMETRTEQLYEEWCGEDRHVNDCRPVHDSSEAIEFAEYYHKEITPQQSIKKKMTEKVTMEKIVKIITEYAHTEKPEPFKYYAKQITTLYDAPDDEGKEIEKCANCKGAGKVGVFGFDEENICKVCHGVGEIPPPPKKQV